MMSKFIHLQTKSHYSIVSGLPKTNQIIDKAVECGMNAVALTDKNTFFAKNVFLSVKATAFMPHSTALSIIWLVFGNPDTML